VSDNDKEGMCVLELKVSAELIYYVSSADGDKRDLKKGVVSL
jgi:hypothetical protein